MSSLRAIREHLKNFESYYSCGLSKRPHSVKSTRNSHSRVSVRGQSERKPAPLNYPQGYIITQPT